MLRKIITEKYQADQAPLIEDIFLSLQVIQQKLEEELTAKQKIIESNWEEIKTLRTAVQEKDNAMLQLEKNLTENQRNNEGNRQIINKLLNDLDRMQQDIEWYKRTYQRRSFFGYLKEYLIGSKIK